MTAGPIASRDRLRRTYASAHPGRAGSGAALIYRRDIRPALPRPSAGPVVDIGCGPGDLVRLLAADGYQAEGVDLSAEQVAGRRRLAWTRCTSATTGTCCWTAGVSSPR